MLENQKRRKPRELQTAESYKKAKIKHKKQNILHIVDKGKLYGLNLMTERYQVITLGLPFMSQLVSVRGAFHNKMVDVRKDSDWTSIKRQRPMMLLVAGILVPEIKI